MVSANLLTPETQCLALLAHDKFRGDEVQETNRDVVHLYDGLFSILLLLFPQSRCNANSKDIFQPSLLFTNSVSAYEKRVLCGTFWVLILQGEVQNNI